MAKGGRFVRHENREVCEMQNAETVSSVIQARARIDELESPVNRKGSRRVRRGVVGKVPSI